MKLPRVNILIKMFSSVKGKTRFVLLNHKRRVAFNLKTEKGVYLLTNFSS